MAILQDIQQQDVPITEFPAPQYIDLPINQ